MRGCTLRQSTPVARQTSAPSTFGGATRRLVDKINMVAKSLGASLNGMTIWVCLSAGHQKRGGCLLVSL